MVFPPFVSDKDRNGPTWLNGYDAASLSASYTGVRTAWSRHWIAKARRSGRASSEQALLGGWTDRWRREHGSGGDSRLLVRTQDARWASKIRLRSCFELMAQYRLAEMVAGRW